MRRLAWIAPLVTLGLAGCGSMSDAERFSLTTPGTDDVVVREVEGSEKAAPKKPTRGEVRVIRGWADALRAGHVNQAAGFFAVPAFVLDGTNPRRQLPDIAAVATSTAACRAARSSWRPCAARAGSWSPRSG